MDDDPSDGGHVPRVESKGSLDDEYVARVGPASPAAEPKRGRRRRGDMRRAGTVRPRFLSAHRMTALGFLNQF